MWEIDRLFRLNYYRFHRLRRIGTKGVLPVNQKLKFL